jgi:hypothetical protein
MQLSGRAAQSAGTGCPAMASVRSRIRQPVATGEYFTEWQNRSAARAVVQIAEIANGLIDPILARRAGINTLLLGILGRDRRRAVCRLFAARADPLAASGRAGRNRWRVSRRDVLTIACEGARAPCFWHAPGGRADLAGQQLLRLSVPSRRSGSSRRRSMCPTRKPKARPLDARRKRRVSPEMLDRD